MGMKVLQKSLKYIGTKFYNKFYFFFSCLFHITGASENKQKLVLISALPPQKNANNFLARKLKQHGCKIASKHILV